MQKGQFTKNIVHTGIVLAFIAICCFRYFSELEPPYLLDVADLRNRQVVVHLVRDTGIVSISKTLYNQVYQTVVPTNTIDFNGFPHLKK